MKIKHALVNTISIAVIVVSTVACVRVWDNVYASQQAKQARAAASQRAHDALQQKAVATEKKHIHDTCVANQIFYDAQNAAYKKTTSRPVCDLAIAQ